MADRQARLGVVVIGRNEGERLVRCLRSLQSSGYPIVYVDSASTDGSAQAASQLGARVIDLDMDQPFTAARARAAGFAALDQFDNGIEYVFFLDGDCEVEQGFLAAAIDYLDRHADFAVACGRRRERYPDASRYNRLLDREWATPIGEATACGGDAVYRCAPYREAGGFDPRMLAGEEPELCGRLREKGWRISRLDEPMTIHDADMHRFSQWWRRAVRSGMGYAQAYLQTRDHPGGGLYRVQMRRTLAWTVVLPLAALLLALGAHPAFLLMWPALVCARALRLGLRDGPFPAWLQISCNYAELWGILRFAARQLLGRSGSTVVYK